MTARAYSRDVGGRLACVADAEAAADVDVRELDAVRFEPCHELGDLPQRLGDRRDVGELRADMAVDASIRTCSSVRPPARKGRLPRYTRCRTCSA